MCLCHVGYDHKLYLKRMRKNVLEIERKNQDH